MARNEIRVKELLDRGYPLIYQAAVDNIERQGRGKTIEDTINMSMIWSDTPQGSQFWSLINEGYFEEAEVVHPHLFINIQVVEENGFAVQINGLFR